MQQESTPSQRRWLYAGAFGFIGLGIALMVFGIYFLADAGESNSWPEVEGSVRFTTVKVDYDSSTQGRRRKRYYYSVTYRYEVSGEMLSASRYSMGDGPRASGYFKERADAEAEAEIVYPAGSAVKVHYDPDNPESAVLRPGVNWGTYMPLVLGLFFSGCGAFLLWGMKFSVQGAEFRDEKNLSR